jgi:hypothetical protein
VSVLPNSDDQQGSIQAGGRALDCDSINEGVAIQRQIAQ